MIFRKRPLPEQALPAETLPDHEEMAAQAFARRRLRTWTTSDESQLESRFARDPAFADAFRRVEQSWTAVGQHATSAELMTLREQALARARRASAQRWRKGSGASRRRVLRMAAAVAALGIALAAAYQFAPFGLRPGEYRTDIGEQRVVELEDQSHVALDAATRLQVRFSKDARIVQLLQGQAQFSVAKDPARPFKVEAGNHTIVALGTVFTVEYIDREMRVAMLEGKVAVLPPASATAPVGEPARTLPPSRSGESRERASGREGYSLIAGEELRVRDDGFPTITPQADLQAAVAWREGKVIFHKEPLGEAVRRLNRYSRLQIEIADPRLATMHVSGVFEAGDAQAFVEAVQAYLPATADYSEASSIRLQLK